MTAPAIVPVHAAPGIDAATREIGARRRRSSRGHGVRRPAVRIAQSGGAAGGPAARRPANWLRSKSTTTAMPSRSGMIR